VRRNRLLADPRATRENPLNIWQSEDRLAQKVMHWRLTFKDTEAYIRPFGALSAYGAIARLRSSSLE
jgi:hypothetical protein